MKYPLVFAGVLAWLGAALLVVAAAGPAGAQVIGQVSTGAGRTEPQGKEEPPPGGCMPIGVTASGEIVFPFLCKGFIEQHKASNQKAAAPDEASHKPLAADTPSKGAGEKSLAKPPDAVTPQTAAGAADLAKGASQLPAVTERPRPKGDVKPASAEDKSAAKSPDSTASIAKSAPAAPAASSEHERMKPREGTAGPPVCARFKSYDASSGTYTDFSGRRRACRA
jgi:hypothetical protein